MLGMDIDKPVDAADVPVAGDDAPAAGDIKEVVLLVRAQRLSMVALQGEVRSVATDVVCFRNMFDSIAGEYQRP